MRERLSLVVIACVILLGATSCHDDDPGPVHLEVDAGLHVSADLQPAIPPDPVTSQVDIQFFNPGSERLIVDATQLVLKRAADGEELFRYHLEQVTDWGGNLPPGGGGGGQWRKAEELTSPPTPCDESVYGTLTVLVVDSEGTTRAFPPLDTKATTFDCVY